MSGQQVKEDVIESHVIVGFHCEREAHSRTLLETPVSQISKVLF